MWEGDVARLAPDGGDRIMLRRGALSTRFLNDTLWIWLTDIFPISVPSALKKYAHCIAFRIDSLCLGGGIAAVYPQQFFSCILSPLVSLYFFDQIPFLSKVLGANKTGYRERSCLQSQVRPLSRFLGKGVEVITALPLHPAFYELCVLDREENAGLIFLRILSQMGGFSHIVHSTEGIWKETAQVQSMSAFRFFLLSQPHDHHFGWDCT